MKFEKLRMSSLDITQNNIEIIGQLFPNVLSEIIDKEGNKKKVLNFDLLKQELSDFLINDKQERYQMTWPEKSKAILEANKGTTMTLRPIAERSQDFNNTKNIFISGDNIEALKIMRESYLGKVKMIYIDPPYNTGSDFIYEDNFQEELASYAEKTGQINDGVKMVQNLESSGRFHTNWLNKIYPRLKIAKDFLSDDGIIFISIDDNEVANLKKICDEIFNEHNFVAQIVVEGTPKNDPKIISTAHEYCLVYVKNYEIAKDCEWGIHNPIFDEILSIFNKFKPDYKKIEEELKTFYAKNDLLHDNIANYKMADERGVFRLGPIDDPQSGGSHDIRYNPYTGESVATPSSGWRCNATTWEQWIKEGLVYFPEDNTKLCAKKTYIKIGQLDLLRAYFKIQTRKDTDMLKNMFGKKVFSFPKPVELIQKFIDSSSFEGALIMDFFAGSATTGHACFLHNLASRNSFENNVHFILVQLPEDLKENLNHATGNREKQVCQNAIDYCVEHNLPVTISSISSERLRLSSEKIRKENGLLANDLDLGFRYFEVDLSNMNDVYYNPKTMTQNLLEATVDNIKPDRTPLDLLFQVMLECGALLSSKIEEKTINGKKIFAVEDNYIAACFDDELDDKTIEEIAKLHPVYACFKGSSFDSDSANINAEQIFKTYSPNTEKVKVI